MAVLIRLARHGRTHRPFYRVVAIDGREHREGRACETLGIYDPMSASKNIQVDIDAVHRWINAGAQYSDSVASLLKRGGYEVTTSEQKEAEARQSAKRKARRQKRAKKDGSKFVAASRRAVKKHEATLKAARLAELKKEQEAKAKAAAEADAAADAGGDAAES